MFPVGMIVGSAQLTKTYDGYFTQLISNRLERQKAEKGKPTKKGRERRLPTKYKIIAQLPDMNEYITLKTERFTVSVRTLIEDANAEVEELKDEMRTWYDNLTEGLQNTDRGQRVDESANSLENITTPEIDDRILSLVLDNITTYYLTPLKVGSRADRAIDAASKYRAAKEAIEDWMEEHKPKKLSVDWDSLKSLADECDGPADDLEDIDFPGMYD
jgi:hypothetical protein